MRRRHRKRSTSAELDITAFMNLMIILVPVLLLGMVFSQIRMIELNFPGDAVGEEVVAETISLMVTLIPEGIEISDSERGLISVLPAGVSGQDFKALRSELRSIKARFPDKTDITLEVGPEVDYQTLVTVMDTVRSYPAVVAASLVEGELFPDVSLIDAPENRKLAKARAPEQTGVGA
ncbi:biopolymer transporter ExbD [Marinobacter salinexigens]|uniref:Biopolymer transporter ExbD n=1 Tax=Marinobacter salinexigens TaxID=2919747 RepID=A0A5B0VKV7_9GAMM|nr:biopolymer transporter ExbD [Marinobacter salinexigens]KAA1175084.1 biopolymer transporter ExbD [Marinobacter salinexigens]